MPEDEAAQAGKVERVATMRELAEQAGQLLVARHLTLGLAESCTGGLVSDLITDVPGSSVYFLGGIVSYAYSAKEALLGVRHETLLAHGAVSPETAAEMAWGARRALRAAIAVSITGVAGPTGGTPDKPVGLVHLHLSADDAEIAERHAWDGDRLSNKARSAEAALRLLLRYLEGPQASQGPGGVQFVDEPVLVEAQSQGGSVLLPVAVTWRGQRYSIADTGRQWQEELPENRIWYFYLVRTAERDTFELRLDVTSGQWRLMRAWVAARLA